MKLDLNIKLKGLDGTESTETIGKSIAIGLSQKTKDIDPIKAHDWAVTLYKDQPIEIDRADLELLKEFIKSSDYFFNLLKGQVLPILNKLKDS